mmetsp:Transcript_4080/g.11449  ORF Transcript_4080/g.11449 Transcript_4080/m.11449 type:complete len:318 (+) Transcript_4080:87-1040(+)
MTCAPVQSAAAAAGGNARRDVQRRECGANQDAIELLVRVGDLVKLDHHLPHVGRDELRHLACAAVGHGVDHRSLGRVALLDIKRRSERHLLLAERTLLARDGLRRRGAAADSLRLCDHRAAGAVSALPPRAGLDPAVHEARAGVGPVRLAEDAQLDGRRRLERGGVAADGGAEESSWRRLWDLAHVQDGDPGAVGCGKLCVQVPAALGRLEAELHHIRARGDAGLARGDGHLASDALVDQAVCPGDAAAAQTEGDAAAQVAQLREGARRRLGRFVTRRQLDLKPVASGQTGRDSDLHWAVRGDGLNGLPRNDAVRDD